MLLTNRSDETQVSAFRYTFHALPFQSLYVVSNITGEKPAFLNITFRTEPYLIYSENFTPEEIKDIGVLEKNGQTFFTLWSSKVDEDKEYVVYGKFTDFYKLGTKEKIPVLFVESYYEVSLLDEFILANEFLLSHFMIGSIVLTASCVLVLLGSIIWFSDEISE